MILNILSGIEPAHLSSDHQSTLQETCNCCKKRCRILHTSRIRKRRHKDPSCVRAPSVRLVIVIRHCVGVFQNGQTFLMEASKLGSSQMVELLLEQEDVNIHAVDNVGCLSIS